MAESEYPNIGNGCTVLLIRLFSDAVIFEFNVTINGFSVTVVLEVISSLLAIAATEIESYTMFIDTEVVVVSEIGSMV